MNEQDFSVTFSVDQTPDEVFAAINDVKSWWTGDIDGRADERGCSKAWTHYVTESLEKRIRTGRPQ